MGRKGQKTPWDYAFKLPKLDVRKLAMLID